MIIYFIYLAQLTNDPTTRVGYYAISASLLFPVYSILDSLGLLGEKEEDSKEKAGFYKEQLRAYSQLSQTLTRSLNDSGRGMLPHITGSRRTTRVLQDRIDKVDELFQKDAYLLSKLSDLWGQARMGTRSTSPYPARDLDLNLLEKLEVDVNEQIKQLRKTLKLE